MNPKERISKQKINIKNMEVSKQWLYQTVFVYGIFILLFVTFSNIPTYTYTPIAYAPSMLKTEDEKADIWEASMLASQKWGVPYELLLGIANAESSMGRNFFGCEFAYNAWGVRPHTAPDGTKFEAEPCNPHIAKYPDYITAADDVARILKTYYIDYGLDTPEKIAKKYVGNHSESWINNVKNY